MSAMSTRKTNRILASVRCFLNDEGGVTSIEYALIAGATGLALAAVMPAVKSNLTTVYTAVGNNLQ